MGTRSNTRIRQFVFIHQELFIKYQTGANKFHILKATNTLILCSFWLFKNILKRFILYKFTQKLIRNTMYFYNVRNKKNIVNIGNV